MDQIKRSKDVVTAPTEVIVRRKLSDEVFDRLRMMITSGELTPGDMMPSERELMERFRVGRPAIREAMQALNNMGLITITHGERARVRQLTARSLFEQVDATAQILLSTSPTSLDHLKNARRFFERGMVREAALKASKDDVARLIWSGKEKFTLSEHEEIIVQIEARDSNGAEAAMTKHLDRSASLYEHQSSNGEEVKTEAPPKPKSTPSKTRATSARPKRR
jgi:DNA-binding FadR family transcriptional regulator